MEKDLRKEELPEKRDRPEGLDEPEEEFNPDEATSGHERLAIATAVVIPVAQFTLNLLKEILTGVLGVNRKIAIGLKNYTRYNLESTGIYFQSGTADQNISKIIKTQEAGLYGARKSQSTARGSVGVFSYYIQGANKTLHVMWSVPYDYNLYSNWWNVAVVNGRQSPNYDVYYGMYNGKSGYPYPLKPDRWVTTSSGGFSLAGSMTNNGQALLEIELK